MSGQRKRPPREWSTYSYYDPRGVLVELRKLELALAEKPVAFDEKVLRLRTGKLRIWHERRQAAIFSYGMASVLDTSIRIAPVESEDFDCIACWTRGDEQVFTPIQIKELVPADLNPTTDLNAELQKLTKYVRSHDLVVAFHVNRRLQLDFSNIVIPQLAISQLWLFGSVSPNGSEYMIYGDVLSSPAYHTFSYPNA